METHIWHAKRFKMVNMADWNGGCRVPLNCNDKSTRSIYKLCQKESACIADLSYYNHIWVRKDAMERILESNLVEFTTQADAASLFNCIHKLKVFERSSTQRVLLAIIDLVWVEKLERCLLVIHPSVTQAVMKLFEEIAFSEREAFSELKY